MTRHRILTAATALLLASCGATPKHYVHAFRATHDAVAPIYREYVEADDSLDDDTRKRRLRTLDAWKVWLQAAEAGK